jgi:multidrug resistance protein MdtO
MDRDFLLPTPTPWLRRFWEDLQPTPGRLNSSLRMTLATILVLVLMLVLQMPFIAYGLYAIFLVGRESPSVSLRSGIISVLTIVFVIVAEMSVVILSDNDPMARVLSVSVVTFLAGMVLVCTTQPSLGSSWGFFYCVVIGFWERHAPEDTLVKNSLHLLAAFSLAAACAIAVEYIFGGRSPTDRLEEQVRIRYKALEEMFCLYGDGADAGDRYQAATLVSRLAAAGQAGMIDLYSQIVDRNLDTGVLPIGTRVRITMLAELMGHAAAFGLQGEAHDDLEFRQRCARIAEECRSLIPTTTLRPRQRVDAMPRMPVTLLDRVEAALHSILVMPTSLDDAKNRELAVLPSKNVPFLIPGAIRDKDNIAFALKISFCATLCYILYNAIDWPGISTSVTTVMVTGLSTTAAMKQRLTLRIFGSLSGGVILGLGTTAFLFPYMDSITSLIILVAPIAFISSWIARGARFNYIGLQIALAFYLVALVDSHAPTELAPARDRFIGIIFALVVMWFVFDQIWPVRTVNAMRRVLSSVLSSGASLFLLVDDATSKGDLSQNADSVRDRVGKGIASLRTMNEAVEYEFGVDREKNSETSEVIVQISIAAAALIWNQVAYLHGDDAQKLLRQPPLIGMRRALAEHLNEMATAVVQRTAIPSRHLADALPPMPLVEESHREYVRNTIARHEDLQSLASMLMRGV